MNQYQWRWAAAITLYSICLAAMLLYLFDRIGLFALALLLACVALPGLYAVLLYDRTWQHALRQWKYRQLPIEQLVAKLEGFDYDAMEVLTKIGTPAVEPLIMALSDSRVGVRKGAAQILGEIGDPRAVEPLIVALCDSEEVFRQNAARSLGMIGDNRAVKPLLTYAWDEKSGVKGIDLAAIEALGRIGDPSALPTLERWRNKIQDEQRAHTGLSPNEDAALASRFIHPIAAEAAYYRYGVPLEGIDRAIDAIRSTLISGTRVRC